MCYSSVLYTSVNLGAIEGVKCVTNPRSYCDMYPAGEGLLRSRKSERDLEIKKHKNKG